MTDAPVVGSGPPSDGADAEPPNKPEIAELTSIAMASFQSGNAGIIPEVAKAIKPEHVAQALSNNDKAHERLGEDHKDRRKQGTIRLAVGTLGTVVLVGMFLFTQNASVLADSIDAIIGAVAGALGGYGFGKRNAG